MTVPPPGPRPSSVAVVVMVVAVLAATVALAWRGWLEPLERRDLMWMLVSTLGALLAHVRGLYTPSPDERRTRALIARDAYLRAQTGRPPPAEADDGEDDGPPVPSVGEIPRDPPRRKKEESP